jgi:hypothetical protein
MTTENASTTPFISDLPSVGSRFGHVIKHLYCRAERWDLAITALSPTLTTDAESSGCPRALLRHPEPSYRDACASCLEHVLRDHDHLLAPAYRAALSTAASAGRFGDWNADERCQQAFVGDNGVFVIAKSASRNRQRHVATAYRVIPRGTPAGKVTARDFFDQAVRKLRDKTTFGDHEAE